MRTKSAQKEMKNGINAHLEDHRLVSVIWNSKFEMPFGKTETGCPVGLQLRHLLYDLLVEGR